MSAILAATTLLGGGLSALGELQAGQEAFRTGQVNASVLRRQAKISLINRQQQERDLIKRATIVRGEVVAGAAGQGTTTSGSVAAILSENARETSLDRLRLLFEQENEAAGLSFQARESKRAGRVARSQSRLAAFGSLLGASGRAAVLSRANPG